MLHFVSLLFKKNSSLKIGSVWALYLLRVIALIAFLFCKSDQTGNLFCGSMFFNLLIIPIDFDIDIYLLIYFVALPI